MSRQVTRDGQAAAAPKNITTVRAEPATSGAVTRVPSAEPFERAARIKRRARAHSALWFLSMSGAAVPLASIDGAMGNAIAFFWLLFSLSRALRVSGEVQHPVVVLDRPVGERPARRVDYDAPSPLLFAPELEALAAGAGVPSLASFQENLREGAARHDPADGIRTVDAILAAGKALPAEVIASLECIRERLVIAQSAQARFCIMRLGGWSAAMESNLRLHWFG